MSEDRRVHSTVWIFAISAALDQPSFVERARRRSRRGTTRGADHDRVVLPHEDHVHELHAEPPAVGSPDLPSTQDRRRCVHAHRRRTRPSSARLLLELRPYCRTCARVPPGVSVLRNVRRYAPQCRSGRRAWTAQHRIIWPVVAGRARNGDRVAPVGAVVNQSRGLETAARKRETLMVGAGLNSSAGAGRCSPSEGSARNSRGADSARAADGGTFGPNLVPAIPIDGTLKSLYEPSIVRATRCRESGAGGTVGVTSLLSNS